MTKLTKVTKEQIAYAVKLHLCGHKHAAITDKAGFNFSAALTKARVNLRIISQMFEADYSIEDITSLIFDKYCDYLKNDRKRGRPSKKAMAKAETAPVINVSTEHKLSEIIRTQSDIITQLADIKSSIDNVYKYGCNLTGNRKIG